MFRYQAGRLSGSKCTFHIMNKVWSCFIIFTRLGCFVIRMLVLITKRSGNVTVGNSETCFLPFRYPDVLITGYECRVVYFCFRQLIQIEYGRYMKFDPYNTRIQDLSIINHLLYSYTRGQYNETYICVKMSNFHGKLRKYSKNIKI